MEHIKKHLYWDKYGVKTFPYRGKRKYLPCIYQDYDGTFMIRNDVFGLTIAQFERDFKALLARRQENEALIQNIRFPTKTTNEYIEYLKYGDDTVQGYRSPGELSDINRQLCELVKVAGTEYDIRIRQRMFILIDNTSYISGPTFKIISSGSLAEGIHLPGSDVDKMYALRGITVIDNLKHLHLSGESYTLLMENDIRYPGFCKLKLVREGHYHNRTVSESLMETDDGVYFSTQKFLRSFLNLPVFKAHSAHGPCISDANQYVDHAICLRSIIWPTMAFNWCNRHRIGQWPSSSVIDSILKDGCLLVPIEPKNSDNNLFWRISFSVAEKSLTHSMNYTQLLCYVLLKLTLKTIINRNSEVKDLLCSYFLKTTVFWLSEEISVNTFKMSNLSQCYFLCIDKLVSFVRNCYCPNYFIPQHNMFIGKINECNNKPILRILVELRNTQLPVIIDRILGSHVVYIRQNELSVDMELLFYRILFPFPCVNVETACKALRYVGLLMKSESSEFLLGVLKYYHSLIKQRILQMIILPERRRDRYNIIRRCHKYLLDGTKTDAVSGWLLYGSSYYVLGQYRKTLQIVDEVLSRCTPDMIPLRKEVYTTEDKNTYKHKTENSLTLTNKMTQATFDNVCFIKRSTLTPQELQLEVEDCNMLVPTVVMSQCLQFLCFHHLGDTNNKQRALRDLCLTMQEEYLISPSESSNSFVILGVCHELSGDKHTAYQCYTAALHHEEIVCPSAERRLANLYQK